MSAPVIHARSIYTRAGTFVHPCGLPQCRDPYDPKYTRTPRVQNWDPATLRMLPREAVNCQGCLEAAK